jgi:hypothetical protein
MNKTSVSRKLAEQICQKKFEELFRNKDIKLDNEIFKLQIPLWKELGKTHLSEYDLKKESPITQALNELCNEKIKWCMNKLLTYESDESEEAK